jgi:hypothetical protein
LRSSSGSRTVPRMRSDCSCWSCLRWGSRRTRWSGRCSSGANRCTRGCCLGQDLRAEVVRVRGADRRVRLERRRRRRQRARAQSFRLALWFFSHHCTRLTVYFSFLCRPRPVVSRWVVPHRCLSLLRKLLLFYNWVLQAHRGSKSSAFWNN